MLAMSATHRHSAGEADVVAGKPKRPPSMQVAATTRSPTGNPTYVSSGSSSNSRRESERTRGLLIVFDSLVDAIVRRVKLFFEGHRFGEPIDRNAIGMCIAR
jgi:hypothetical protein